MSVPTAADQRVDARPGGDPMTTVVANELPAGRVRTRSTTIESPA